MNIEENSRPEYIKNILKGVMQKELERWRNTKEDERT